MRHLENGGEINDINYEEDQDMQETESNASDNGDTIMQTATTGYVPPKSVRAMYEKATPDIIQIKGGVSPEQMKQIEIKVNTCNRTIRDIWEKSSEEERAGALSANWEINLVKLKPCYDAIRNKTEDAVRAEAFINECVKQCSYPDSWRPGSNVTSDEDHASDASENADGQSRQGQDGQDGQDKHQDSQGQAKKDDYPSHTIYPWTTMTIDGGNKVILAVKKRGYGRQVITETLEQGRWVLRIEPGRNIVEVDEYLRKRGRLLLDPQDQARWADNKKENEGLQVLKTTISSIKLRKPGSNRQAESYNLVRTKSDEIRLYTWSTVRSVLGTAAARKAVSKSCEADDILPPWDVEPDYIVNPRKEQSSRVRLVTPSREPTPFVRQSIEEEYPRSFKDQPATNFHGLATPAPTDRSPTPGYMSEEALAKKFAEMQKDMMQNLMSGMRELLQQQVGRG